MFCHHARPESEGEFAADFTVWGGLRSESSPTTIKRILLIDCLRMCLCFKFQNEINANSVARLYNFSFCRLGEIAYPVTALNKKQTYFCQLCTYHSKNTSRISSHLPTVKEVRAFERTAGAD